VQKNQAFAIFPLVIIVSGDDPQNADGVHLGWFLPPFSKGGGISDTSPPQKSPLTPLFQKGGFLQY
jgi:hypothetical protein